MLADLTSHQLSEWEMFEVLDPDESTKMDWRFAMLYAVLVDLFNAAFGGKKTKGKKGEDPRKFFEMFSWNSRIEMIDGLAVRRSDRAAKRQKLSDMKEFLMSLAGATKGSKKGGTK